MPKEEEIKVEYEKGTSKTVSLFDNTKLNLHKLAKDWDPTNIYSAKAKLEKTKREGNYLTGLIYVNPDSKDLHDIINTVDTPLNQLNEEDLYPGDEVLESINTGFR